MNKLPVSKWEGQEVDAIVCGPRPVVAGSVMVQCIDCNDELWMSPSSFEVLLKHPNTASMCIKCALKRAKENQ